MCRVFRNVAAGLSIMAGVFLAGPANSNQIRSEAVKPTIGWPAMTQACAMAERDKRWLRDVLRTWPSVRARYLKASPASLPLIVMFDGKCAYQIFVRNGSKVSSAASEHGGTIKIPGGPSFPFGPQAAFNSTNAGGHFLLMSLPSVWASVAPKSEIPLGWFLEGVFFHEMTHALQAELTPSVWYLALQQKGISSKILNDDAVQQNFNSVSAYEAEFRAERDLLLGGAREPDPAIAKLLTCRALAKLQARRARYFTGKNGDFAQVDEVALTSEGLGQWVQYAWLTKGRKLPSSTVLSKLRGPFWSQDEGLAIFLVMDRLISSWQKSVFDTKLPATVERLLARLCAF